MKILRAPFPWFGGKSRAAHLVWPRFGDVPNYVEPFAGSLAVLLGRPTSARIETVNDLDCFVANFWRSVNGDPEAVAAFADWPVNEADLHARHRWLVSQEGFRERMKSDPDFYDAKIAGWWVWGICQWIGSGWCATTPRREIDGRGRPFTRKKLPSESATQRVHLSGAQGIETAVRHMKRPVLAHGGNRGVTQGTPRGQKPLLRGDAGAAGAGIHASGLKQQIPFLNRDGMGVATAGKLPKMDRGTLSRLVPEQLPDLGGNGGAAGKGVTASAKSNDAILGWMLLLQDRLRRVRVCCGDWTRVLGRSATECIGVTAIFLDPPYGTGADRDPAIYSHDSLTIAAAVREWALANGDNPKLRIALCGYEGEHEMPDSWECVAWKANGGYASSAGNHANSKRERIWFSPHCLPQDATLFSRLHDATTSEVSA